jgi:hypothetical protein
VTFLWGYVKEKVFVPPIPVTLVDLKQRITTATGGVDENMLTRVWQEFHYRVDICRVTMVHTHITSVSCCNKLREFLYKTVQKPCILIVDILNSLGFIKC